MNENIKREDVFKIIAESSVYGNLGLFIGAGLPMALLNSDWNKVALNWKELIFKVAENVSVDADELIQGGLSYPEIVTNLCKKYSEREAVSYSAAVSEIKQVISDLSSWYPKRLERDKYGKFFNTMDPAWIITTNYDLVIESILTGRGYSLTPDNQMVSPKGQIPVYHIHGIRTNPSSIIITQEDYVSLFRPNEYRQQKLPLILKESLTILIGYNLGDINVLTAVDWSRNVYSEQKSSYPHGIIQFLYTKNSDPKVYRDRDKIIIVEFNSLESLLEELSKHIIEHKKIFDDQNNILNELNEMFQSPSDEIVLGFITDKPQRDKILEVLKGHNNFLINGFLELLSIAIDLTWDRAKPDRAFSAYNENLTILMDIFQALDYTIMPPALFESLSYNLNRVAYYIGSEPGKSFEANTTWHRRKSNLSPELMKELKNVATVRGYYHLKRLIN